MEKTEWLSQVRKGILEYSILTIIHKKPVYGYDLLSILNQHETLSTTEGTVYPLLRRLEKNHLISSSWKETVSGVPPRKYYNLTDKGKSTLQMMDTEWQNVISSVAQIKNSEESKQ